MVNKPSRSADFLDLTLTICNGRVKASLFEKKQNLYLYLPPHSAHPPGVLKGLIAGMLLQIIRLTTNPGIWLNHVRQQYNRLIVRGFQAPTLQPKFKKFWDQYHLETPATAREPGNPIFVLFQA
jgi:hypothetical protein